MLKQNGTWMNLVATITINSGFSNQEVTQLSPSAFIRSVISHTRSHKNTLLIRLAPLSIACMAHTSSVHECITVVCPMHSCNSVILDLGGHATFSFHGKVLLFLLLVTWRGQQTPLSNAETTRRWEQSFHDARPPTAC